MALQVAALQKLKRTIGLRGAIDRVLLSKFVVATHWLADCWRKADARTGRSTFCKISIGDRWGSAYGQVFSPRFRDYMLWVERPLLRDSTSPGCV